MAQLEAAGISSTQQHPASLTTQENQATIHDFLSLCGAAVGRYNSAATGSTQGSQVSSTTQDFLQPLQRSLIPTGNTSTNLRSSSYALCTSKPCGGGTDENGGGQQSCYALGNGSFEPKESFPSKYRSANIAFGPRGHVAHALPLTKHWQQQSGIEVFDGNRRLSRGPSEEDDDEDDESFEHIYSAKKDGRNQKGENLQPMDGRNAEKGVTPRSKHSATEQRRRSKINDRFQMLRQLLPNADQKRDKASFLLEVIEYIQMLHEKVKKYEGLEVRGQQQERLKNLSWDRSSGQQDATLSPVQDSKEVPDANGYARSRSSPLTTMSDDGITSSGLMCTMKQASALQGVLSFDSKPIVTKPMPLNFSTAPPATTIEQGSNQSHQNIIPENQSFFNQLLRQEDQATTRARDLMSQKIDTLQPHLLQPKNVMIHQDLHQAEDQRLPCSRYMDQNSLSALVLRRAEEEAEGQNRLNDAAELGSFVGSFVSKPLIGLDGRAAPACPEQRTEVVPSKVQEEPTVLGGSINISSTYSQGLLDTLTRALQSSGVDMGQATISVQIDLGKPESLSSKQIVPSPPMISTPQNQQTVFMHDPEPPHKKLKVEAD